MPEVVFHAAAHKHVPILEDFACEAIRTNVFGSLNVLNACIKAQSEHVVFISTDKAATPTSVMGASKWVAEQILLARAPHAGYGAVRFGNVLGSRGSVIPTFQRQIAEGGPVTVTDRRHDALLHEHRRGGPARAPRGVRRCTTSRSSPSRWASRSTSTSSPSA